jgi:hypothetical protein
MNIPTAPWGGIFRSVLAVAAGFVAVVVLSVGTDMALVLAGAFPRFDQPSAFTTLMLLIATAYRSAFAIAGGYVAAWLAPNRPMEHAMALGIVGLVVSAAGAAAMWGYGPAWYPLALIAIAVPASWCGGKLYQMSRPSG